LAGSEGIGVEAEAPFREGLEREGGGEEVVVLEFFWVGLFEVVEGGFVAGAGEQLIGDGVLGLGEEEAGLWGVGGGLSEGEVFERGGLAEGGLSFAEVVDMGAAGGEQQQCEVERG
jgi:hypothetical protein